MRSPGSPAWTRRAILLVFALSGASGLIYELVWMRRLTLIFGSTTLATSTVLAAFMGGLALGSYLFGRFADRSPETALFTYGLLEVAIALLAVLMPLLFRGVEAVYLRAYPRLEGMPQLFFVVQFLLAAVVIMLPTTLMGGTLPLLGRAVVLRLDEVAGRVGTLYAANTFGAGAGTALATYLLLPFAGLWRSQLLAALLNLAAGGTALMLDGYLRLRRPPVQAEPARTEKARTQAIPAAVKVLLVGTALSGFAAMLNEVVWARALALVLGSSVYALGMMLLVFLIGLGIGSALFARWRLSHRQTVATFALAQAGIAAASLLGVVLIPHLPVVFMRAFPLIEHSFIQQQLLSLFLASVLVLPPAILFGIAFPAVIAATAGALRTVGRGVGSVAALNTIGTVVGAFLGGFVLIPQLGLRATLMLAAAATTASAVAVIWMGPLSSRRGRPLVTLLAAVPLLLALVLPPWSREVLASGAAFYAPVYKSVDELLAAVRETELLYYRDGVSSTISVDRQGNHRFYRVNGKTDASTDPGDMANQLLLGHLPMLLHPDPADVFILGLGTGVTAGAVARYPVRSIEIVDIEPAAREATRFFEAENRRVLADPRARLITADGRNALLARPRTYDVIISDPSDLWVAGVGTLFTREFYEVARSRLRPGGIMVQWIHTHALLPAQLKLIVATFRSAFPATSLWRPNRGDIILMGSVAPVVWDYDRLRQRMEGAGVAEDLQRIGLWHPLALFAAFVLDGPDLERLLLQVREVHADDRPVIEFLTPRSFYANTTPLNDAGVQRVQRRRLPEVRGYEPARDRDARAIYLLGFGYASLGRTDLAIDLMEESTRADPTNAKYLIGLGNQYRAKGRTGQAAGVYRRALVLSPGDAEAVVELAALLRVQGEDRQAEEVLRQALRAAPQEIDLLVTLGTVLLDSGRAAEALPLLSRGVAKEPRNKTLRLLSGRAMRILGRHTEAVTHLRQAVALAPAEAAVHRALAEVLLEAGRIDEAVEAFQRALALAPKDVEALIGLARAARRQGDLTLARQARERALRLDPYHPAVLDLPRN